MQNRTQRRKRVYPTLQEELNSALDAQSVSDQEASAFITSVLKALLLVQGVGVLRNEESHLIVEAYEDEECNRHVILARLDTDYVEDVQWCTPLFEIIFSQEETILRWLSEQVAANLPASEEDSITDCKRCLALFKCLLYGHLSYDLQERVLCSVNEMPGRGEGQRYNIALFQRRGGMLSFYLNSSLEIAKMQQHGCGVRRQTNVGRCWRQNRLEC